MSKELKPCPFCGETKGLLFLMGIDRPNPERRVLQDCKTVLEHLSSYYADIHVDIVCETCGAHMKIEKTVPEAVAMWNKRAEDTKKKLKPCPFCGGNVSVVEVEPRLYRPSHNHPYTVACYGCELLFGYEQDYVGVFDTEDEAIAAWNRRCGE